MITAISEVMARCYEKGWITTRDGNASLRRSLDGKISDFMHITPKGVRKNTIKAEDMIKLNINAPVSQWPDVSTEFHMHHHLLIDATSTRAVLHVHPTYVVAAIYAGLDLQEIVKDFPEISRYTKVGPTVPILPAGSHDLATSTNSCMRNYETGPIRFDIVGQANHGVCSVGKNPWDAYEHVERLDHICQIILASGGKNVFS